MNKTFFWALLALFAIVVQSVLLSWPKPDLLLIIVCFYALRRGQLHGMIFGGGTGLVLDAISGFIIGPQLLSKAIVGFLFISLKEKFFNWGIFLNTLAILLFFILDSLIVFVCLETFATEASAGRNLSLFVPGIYTVILGMLAYPILRQKEIKVEEPLLS
ncbi:MAG TPA: rod shape-determining protein MreD [Nitrospiraceae bacterium]|nr:rod shape-determining protein MreD [Nitrospiraceae bacterium]